MRDGTAAGEHRRRRARGDKGVALVEFAIVAPLVFMLILGSITAGVSLSRKNSMTNAVREGSRFGATLSNDGAWANDVRDRVLDLAAGDLTSAQVCVKLVQAPATEIAASSCPTELAGLEPDVTGVTAGECAVLVWARRTSKIEAIVYSDNVTLDSRSISRYERECP